MLVRCGGVWVKDRQHGLQLRADVLEVELPNQAEGIERFLALVEQRYWTGFRETTSQSLWQ